jgi:hypothetical protein
VKYPRKGANNQDYLRPQFCGTVGCSAWFGVPLFSLTTLHAHR